MAYFHYLTPQSLGNGISIKLILAGGSQRNFFILAGLCFIQVVGCSILVFVIF